MESETRRREILTRNVRQSDSGIEQRLRGNERIWAGFREIEIRMLAAETLHAVIAVLSRDVPKFFPGVHAVSVAWLDPDYELTRLLEQEDGQQTTALLSHFTRRCLE